MRFFFLIWLAAALFAAAPTSLALVGGYPVYSGQFPSVFVFTGEEEVLQESFCTATKVAPDWILTAAHCLLAQGPPTEKHFGPWKEIAHFAPGHSLQYSVERNPIGKSQRLLIEEIRFPPSVERCLNDPLNDVESCHSLTPLPDVALVRVVPQSSFLSLKSAVIALNYIEAGTYLDVVGYGAERDGEFFQQPLRLTSHGAVTSTTEFIIQSLKNTEAIPDAIPSFFHFFGVINDPGLAGHTNLGSGDSGGPVFLWGTQQIVGINSHGFCPIKNPECQVTNNSFFSRLNFLPWTWWPKSH